jgi:hypothetical protein
MCSSLPVRRSALASALATLSLATPAAPQMVIGRVVDATTGAPVPGVEITLFDTLGVSHATVLGGSTGEFFFMIPSPGAYRLRAARLGYATAETRPIEIKADEAVEVELRLAVRPVELEPLTVVVQRRERLRERDLREYYERIERYGRSETGPIRIFAREDLEDWKTISVGTMLEYNAPYWDWAGVECAPKVYIDGDPDRYIHRQMLLSNFEAIEYYRGYGPAGTRFWDPDGCGVVLIWTRPRPSGVTSPLLVGGAIVLFTVFTLLAF